MRNLKLERRRVTVFTLTLGMHMENQSSSGCDEDIPTRPPVHQSASPSVTFYCAPCMAYNGGSGAMPERGSIGLNGVSRVVADLHTSAGIMVIQSYVLLRLARRLLSMA